MDLNSIMQQARVMQEKMTKIQQELAKKVITGSAGGGDIDMLQDLVVAATNDALRRAKELSKQELAQLTGGLNLPGLTNFMQN